MGNFGDAISSLLDTYSQCLSLLRRHEGNARGSVSGDEFNGISDKGTSGLAAALRKARARVSRNYTSGVARRGSAFEDGDAASKKSLKQILDRLTTTISGLGSWFARSDNAAPGSPEVALSYSSLVSLCNSSRSDAVRTMTDLSSRIGSRTSIRSSVPLVPAAEKKVNPKSKSKSKAKSKSSRKSETSRSSTRSRRKKHKSEEQKSEPRAQHYVSEKQERHRDPSGSRSGRSTHSKRHSRLTMSSTSTKLGELRTRRRVDYGSTVAYPRRSLEFSGDVPFNKKRWWHF